MLKQVTLTNFRQHRDLTINFTPGLNVLRGANEAGKSTLLEAIGYAFYGANFLRESLTETVTWGEPESTLRVEVSFHFDGLDGLIKRGKSGAELLYGTTRVTGQTEVSRHFERLLGTNLAMANNLQIASQNKVRGTVEGGGAAAVNLIESLADFSLLEQLVDRITQHRPCGNLTSTQERLERLEAATTTAIPPEPSREALEAAAAALEAAAAASEQATMAVAEAAAGVAAARAAQQEAQRLADRKAAGQRDVVAVQAKLQTPAPEVEHTPQDVEKFQAAMQAEQQRIELLQAFSVKLPSTDAVWTGSREAFMVAGKEATDCLKSLQADLRQAELDKARTQALRINETTCALCKKDLADVPEVAKLNADTDAAVAALSARIQKLQTEIRGCSETLDSLKAIHEQDAEIARLCPERYWTWDMGVMPRAVIWKGAPVSSEADTTDYPALIRKAQASWSSYSAWEATQKALKAQLVAAEEAAAIVVPDVSHVAGVLEEYAKLEKAAADARVAKASAEGVLRLAKTNYDHAVQVRSMLLKEAEEARRQIEEAKKELKDKAFYNELIKKIRGARPAVANKLWALVLHAVSNYTTHGRGQPSVVTRTESGFMINGKSIKGFSGSAQDVVGMAVRLALVKTFLPNTPFMVMDEIAAACDDDRELQMLGMVIAADIPQVLLVTHSDAAESFATNFIQL